MTREELNSVRNLRKKLDLEQQNLAELKENINPATSNLARGKNSRGANIDSPTEKLAILIVDAERKIRRLSKRLDAEISNLSNKIQAEVAGEKERALLIHRYINCRRFREIGALLKLSESHVYFTHRKILQKLLVDNSCESKI